MSKIVLFAGAGISAESGLATFREVGGIWDQFDVDEVCNINAFKKAKEDKEKRAEIFKFYNLVKNSILKAQPNAAHYQVANWQKKYGQDRVVILTANIDNLFEKAGCENVIHIHGDIFNMHCYACNHTWNIGDETYNHEPRCPYCDSRLTKPNIVFFGEQAPLYETMAYHVHPKRRNTNDTLICVGTSMSVIHPTRLMPDYKRGVQYDRVLVNKDMTDLDYMFNHKYYGNATEQLAKVDEDIIKRKM